MTTLCALVLAAYPIPATVFAGAKDNAKIAGHLQAGLTSGILVITEKQ